MISTRTFPSKTGLSGVSLCGAILVVLTGLSGAATGEEPATNGELYPEHVTGELPTFDGFRGIWYANQKSKDEYVYKYSGGKATYPHQHHPIAIYRPEADKTFFVWGGTYKDKNTLLHMVSYFDHKTKQVARPRVLLDKRTDDAHDNPVLSIDNDGHLYIFSSAHGTGRPSYIHKSTKPYDISSFDHLLTTNFSYPQPWYLPEHGFVFMHTKYIGGHRVLHVMRSQDGKRWDEPQMLAHIEFGHYQVSQPHGNTIGTAFDMHPEGKGLNFRTNVYYMHSDDAGRTWKTVDGKPLDTPLTDAKNPALVRDYQSEGLLCYIKGLRYTAEGHPVILYTTSLGFESGPQNDPRTYTTARWTGSEWEFRDVTRVDNNYDYASLDIGEDGSWVLLGDTETGPQAYNTGGEVALWKSDDQGATWTKVKQLTNNSKYNHYYPRKPLNAHPDFFALWADGHAREPSESRLYFTDREGSAVWMLPPDIEGEADMVEPIRQ
jgi:hypothetical protein